MADQPSGIRKSHYDLDPNHIILLLDYDIGDPGKYRVLKKAFDNNTDPRSETSTMLRDRDLDVLIRDEDPGLGNSQYVQSLLQTFTSEDACLKAFERYKDKRIFFITSAELGQHAIPKIIKKYQQVFTDEETNKRYSSMYVFYHHIATHLPWAQNYSEYIQMFNFDAELLERLIRDIAEHYIERGERLYRGNDLKNALQCLSWAKTLFFRYDKMQQEIPTDNPQAVIENERAKEITKLIEEIESKLSTESINEDDERSDDNVDIINDCSNPSESYRGHQTRKLNIVVEYLKVEQSNFRHLAIQIFNRSPKHSWYISHCEFGESECLHS